MEKIYYFTENDLSKLKEKIAEIKARIEDVVENKARSTTETSETWHDNFEFEDGERQHNMLMKQLHDLDTILSSAHIAEIPNGEVVRIGSTVVVEDIDTGRKQEYTIASFMSFSEAPNQISYKTPMGKLLMNRVVGEKISGKIGSRELSLVVKEIK